MLVCADRLNDAIHTTKGKDMNDLEEQAREYLIRNFGEPMPGSIITPKQAPELMADFARTIVTDYERVKAENEKPVDMILLCPRCQFQHVDEPDFESCKNCGGQRDAHKPLKTESGIWCNNFEEWNNPPHRKHRCLKCNHVWKPALIATNGVQALNRDKEGGE